MNIRSKGLKLLWLEAKLPFGPPATNIPPLPPPPPHTHTCTHLKMFDGNTIVKQAALKTQVLWESGVVLNCPGGKLLSGQKGHHRRVAESCKQLMFANHDTTQKYIKVAGFQKCIFLSK